MEISAILSKEDTVDARSSRNQEDMIMKHAMQVFAQVVIEYFGETKKVKEIVYTEEIDLKFINRRMDYLFLMDDDTYTHFEIQTTDNVEEDLARFSIYDAVLFSQTKREVYTYVIFSNNIKNPITEYQNGFNTYKIKAIFMANKNADEILTHIETKLINDEALTSADQMDLVFLPIMGGKSTKAARLEKALTLFQQYEIDEKDDIQSMLYTFALKFLTITQMKSIKEIVKMTVLGQMIKDDGIAEGIKRGMEKGMEKQQLETAKALLTHFADDAIIAEVTKLPIETVADIRNTATSL
ncbi:hypothetical protein [Candidatus Epulonipiscium viviparus]|uniref:hypothetical protein n=1 Tax=Candidatus Epulonipiscium viviparus TaxID=420336 RepID=UPI00016C0076|nr:hypothetical protein [Candidatus Epulopiscium viviparus]